MKDADFAGKKQIRLTKTAQCALFQHDVKCQVFHIKCLSTYIFLSDVNRAGNQIEMTECFSMEL